MGKLLSFETGVVEYDINGAAKVRFNPTDAEFTERLYRAFSALDAKQEGYRERVSEIGDDREGMFEYARERDAEMRAIIDGLLGEGVADALFPDMNCYALADGLPVWVNLMFAIADEIHDAYTTQEKKGDPRVKAYNQKYTKMMSKYKRGK